MTIREALRDAEDRLRGAFINSAGVDAAILMAHALGDTLAHLPTRFRDPMEPAAQDAYSALVDRRAEREPLAYIIGETEFMGLPIKCDPRAFVPRPDTELLVETVIRELAPGWSGQPAESRPEVIAEVGTGSGCVAISLAHFLPRVRIMATEMDPDALDLARENAALNGVTDRMTFLCGEDLEPLVSAGLAADVTVLVANPPYVPTDHVVRLDPEVSEREPLMALDGGEDGQGFFRRVLPLLGLLPSLRLVALEFGYAQEDSVQALLAQHLPQWPARILHDLADLPRVIVARSPHALAPSVIQAAADLEPGVQAV